jgi:subtilisin family serine protease
VLDTGVDANHPALSGRLLPGWDFVDNDNDPSEVGDQQTGPYGHGTHVAGTIALVAPEAKIIPLRVLDEGGLGNMWVLAEALAFALDPDGNPNTADGADVINMSLTTLRETELIESLLDKACGGESNDFPVAVNPYLVVVAAAGNGGDSTKQYPAAEDVDGLIAVAASTSTDRLASWSTRASWVQVAAPGDGILSTVPGGLYGTWRGTSMAAPFVAGEVALVRARFPKLNNKDTVRHVERTSVEIDADVKFRIDAGRALTTLPDGDSAPTPTPTPTKRGRN